MGTSRDGGGRGQGLSHLQRTGRVPGAPVVWSYVGVGRGQKGAGSPRAKQLCPDVAQGFLLPQRQALGVKGGDLKLVILYLSLSWGGKCQGSSWESSAGYPAYLPASPAGREGERGGEQ